MPVLGCPEPVSNKDKQVINPVTRTQNHIISADISADVSACGRVLTVLGLLLTDLGLRLNSP
jgi:hypothetical protein